MKRLSDEFIDSYIKKIDNCKTQEEAEQLERSIRNTFAPYIDNLDDSLASNLYAIFFDRFQINNFEILKQLREKLMAYKNEK